MIPKSLLLALIRTSLTQKNRWEKIADEGVNILDEFKKTAPMLVIVDRTENFHLQDDSDEPKFRVILTKYLHRKETLAFRVYMQHRRGEHLAQTYLSRESNFSLIEALYESVSSDRVLPLDDEVKIAFTPAPNP